MIRYSAITTILLLSLDETTMKDAKAVPSSPRNCIVVKDCKNAISKKGGDWCSRTTAAMTTGMVKQAVTSKKVFCSLSNCSFESRLTSHLFVPHQRKMKRGPKIQVRIS